MDCYNREELHLISKVRILWMQHSEWTRMAFVSIIFDNPDEEAVLDRLLRNPVDFAHSLEEFYGSMVAFKFSDLLAEHLILAGALVKATMAEDTMEAEKINRRLYENADEISTLLCSINPYWSYESWRMMLFKHLDLAKMMASQLINGNYKESIKTYDRFEAEVMVMAEMMYEGILKQFSHKFCK